MKPSLVRSSFLLLLGAGLLACGKQVDVGQDNPGSGGGANDGGSTAAGNGHGGNEGGGGSGGAAEVGGADIAIRLRASTSPVEHDDGLSGQTPLAHLSGIRSLKLFKSATDEAPLTVFDFGADAAETGYNDGDDTLIATVKAKTLPRETYTLARVVHSHTRYTIAATVHASGLSAPGQFENMQVLSDGSRVDGELRDHGYFESTFKTGGMSFHTTGENAPVPEWQGSGGFSIRFEEGESAYYFPVSLPIEPDIDHDITVVLSVNMHESFRWEDVTSAGYAKGVFDTTTSTIEPVKRFGPNIFQVTLE